MYDNKNQSDGAIYTNDYKNSEKQPDWTGKVSVSRDMLKELVELPRMAKSTSMLDWIFHRKKKSQSQ
jgi:hypothetical protein